jgi:hypothetical protein
VKRIKHNNLLPWFLMIIQTLPRPTWPAARSFLTVSSSKPRAASRKRQAASNKQKGKNVRNFYNFY